MFVKIKHKDANRCIVKLTVNSINGLSLPQNKNTWQGKVVQHNSKSRLQNAKDKDNRGYYHCLKSNYQWFDKPFDMKERNSVILNNLSSWSKIYTTRISAGFYLQLLIFFPVAGLK